MEQQFKLLFFHSLLSLLSLHSLILNHLMFSQRMIHSQSPLQSMEINSHSLSHQDLFILVCRSVYLLESHLELIQYTHLTIEVSNRISLIQTQLSFRVKVLSILFILFYLSCVVLIIIIVVPIIINQIKSHHYPNPDQY